MSDPVLSVVVPVYNEEETLLEFHRRMSAVLKEIQTQYELIFVDDGSVDRSAELLRNLRMSDRNVAVLTLSRNFGHQIAVKAGIDHAKGEAVIMIDADLQDPPEEIPRLIEKWKAGHDVVYTFRTHRDGESFFKKATASVFYRLMSSISSVHIPRDAGDFRLISREVADVIRSIREKNPYLRGLVAWTGFRQIGVPVHRHARHAGTSKYSLTKMLHLAWSGVTQFSSAPLYVSGYAGLGLAVLGLAIWAAAGIRAVVSGVPVSALALTVGTVSFLGGIQLVAVAVMGLYVGRNYDEARNRPLYILKKDI